MKTLFKVNFNWTLYFGLIFFIRLVWFDISWYSFIALSITLHQFMILFYSIGTAIPIRYLFGAFMCLQMFLGPTFAYNGLDKYQYIVYQMKVPEAVYFQYMIPAVTLFIIGLHISAGKLKGEIIDEKAIKLFADHAGNLPYIFIGIGFIASIVSAFFSSDLAFVFYLLGSFKFIGAFILILQSKRLHLLPLLIVFGSIILSSLASAMFHDLLTWLIMLGAVLAIKFKPSTKVKGAVAAGFIILAVSIQLLKGDYRKVAWGQQEGGSVESLEKVYQDKQENEGLFNYESLAESNIRINQGFIVTNIMDNIPSNLPFENGAELLKIFESALLPRILAPNKLNAGDREVFMKYSGMRIQKGTSMGLSSVGDGYINFGVLGGAIFMFFLGLLFSQSLNAFFYYSKYYPVLLLFTPLVFYYPIRPDCELQTSLGHLVKATVLIVIVFKIWKHLFVRSSRNPHPEELHNCMPVNLDT